MKIGRYRIFLGKYGWFPNYPYQPLSMWRYWWGIIIKEAHPTDIDKVQRFPISTVMDYEGKSYRYFKADRKYKKGEVVIDSKIHHQKL